MLTKTTLTGAQGSYPTYTLGGTGFLPNLYSRGHRVPTQLIRVLEVSAGMLVN